MVKLIFQPVIFTIRSWVYTGGGTQTPDLYKGFTVGMFAKLLTSFTLAPLFFLVLNMVKKWNPSWRRTCFRKIVLKLEKTFLDF